MALQNKIGESLPEHGSERGFTLLEVLVAIVVLSIRLLGLAALQGKALTAEAEAYQRAQATVYLDDIVERLNAHRRVAPCFVTLSPYGTGAATTFSCAGSGQLGADGLAEDSAAAALQAWSNLLTGGIETWNPGSGAQNIGGIQNARGCIFAAAGDANLYYIAVAWQGRTATVAPAAPNNANSGLVSAVACGSGSYGDETFRRVVWTSVRIAILS